MGLKPGSVNHNAQSRIVGIMALLLLTPVVQARENCGVEVKLLLSSGAAPDTISSFNLAGDIKGQVYFFDTDALDLLSKGVIVRLRQGSVNDLTVKIRPSPGESFTASSVENVKCEIDVIGGQSIRSYSVQKKYSALQVPDGGSELVSLFSDGQKKVLQQAGVPIEWGRVKRIVSIQSTDWTTSTQPSFGKLTLELWEWPKGSVLELSTKVGHNDGPTSYAALVRLVNEKFLSISANQSTKTRMVLESTTGQSAK